MLGIFPLETQIPRIVIHEDILDPIFLASLYLCHCEILDLYPVASFLVFFYTKGFVDIQLTPTADIKVEDQIQPWLADSIISVDFKVRGQFFCTDIFIIFVRQLGFRRMVGSSFANKVIFNKTVRGTAITVISITIVARGRVMAAQGKQIAIATDIVAFVVLALNQYSRAIRAD